MSFATTPTACRSRTSCFTDKTPTRTMVARVTTDLILTSNAWVMSDILFDSAQRSNTTYVGDKRSRPLTSRMT